MIEIIHISDLHFGKSKAWTEKACGLLKEIRKAFPFKKNPCLRLLVTGDTIHNSSLGKGAWRDQYRMAREALSPFRSKLVIVPGNHDYGFGGFVFSKELAKYFDMAFLPALGLKHGFRTKEPHFDVLDDGERTRVVLIGLNSCLMKLKPQNIAKGKIEKRQRTHLEKILNKRGFKGIPKIVHLHHIPHRRAKGIGMSLTDHAELMPILEDKVAAVAFGHDGKMEDPGRRRARGLFHKDRRMKIRRAGHRGIKYYLDANACVRDRSCYAIRVDGTDVTARLVSFGAAGNVRRSPFRGGKIGPGRVNKAHRGKTL